MEAKNTYDGRRINRSYLEIGGTVDVQNTYSVIGTHDPKSISESIDPKKYLESSFIITSSY